MGYRSNSNSVPYARRPTAKAIGTAIAVFMCVGTTVRVAHTQSGTLSEELNARIRQYVDTWNSHNAADLAEYFTADADMIMGNGPILDGRKAIQSAWREYFAVQEPERRLTIEIQAIRRLTAEVALVNVRTTTGGRTAQELELPARMFRGTWVLLRQNGDWLITALRGMPMPQDRIIRGGG